MQEHHAALSFFTPAHGTSYMKMACAASWLQIDSNTVVTEDKGSDSFVATALRDIRWGPWPRSEVAGHVLGQAAGPHLQERHCTQLAASVHVAMLVTRPAAAWLCCCSA